MSYIDYSGHEIKVLSASWRARNGQWCLLRLKDALVAGKLAEMGAHLSRDNKLVCIFQDHYVTPKMVHTKADGTVIVDNGEHIPARFVVVDSDGNNLPVILKQPGRGIFVADAFFHLGSSAIATVEPLVDMADFPPGRVHNKDWKPSA